jgi:hypothetical protein
MEQNWTLIVYLDGTPRRDPYTSEEEARKAAGLLEAAGWRDGIPDTILAPSGQVVWHRPHDAAG